VIWLEASYAFSFHVVKMEFTPIMGHHQIYRHKADKEYIQDNRLLELIRNNLNVLLLWGESAFPHFFGLIKYLELNGEDEIARSLLNDLLTGVISSNGPGAAGSLANPYYSVNDVLEAVSGIDMEKIDFTQFSGSSYTLEVIIQMIARRNRREVLEKNWRQLSHIAFKEFRPDEIEDTFAWLTREGSNHVELPKATQSWAELVKEANDLKGVPDLYLQYSDLLRFFILVCPHRTNKLVIRALDTTH